MRLVGKGLDRTLSTCLRRSLSTLRAKTVVNVDKIADNLVDEDGAFMMIAATSQHSPELIELIKSIPRDSKKQVVAVAVDTIPIGCQRNGISILTSNSRAALADATPWHDSDVATAPNLRGVTTGRSNWTLSKSFLGIDVGGSSLTIPVANTLFYTGTSATILYHDQHSPLSGHLLSSLRITLPLSHVSSWQSFAPLCAITDPMEVSQAKDNLVQKINGKPAASFLESNTELMSFSPTSSGESTKVFASVTRNGVTSRYRVEAGGGGGWSPRAGQLALDPTANVRRGDMIFFEMAVPVRRLDNKVGRQLHDYLDTLHHDISPSLMFECAPVLESVSEDLSLRKFGDSIALENIFGIGCESGFLVGDFKHAVEGESVVARVD